MSSLTKQVKFLDENLYEMRISRNNDTITENYTLKRVGTADKHANGYSAYFSIPDSILNLFSTNKVQKWLDSIEELNSSNYNIYGRLIYLSRLDFCPNCKLEFSDFDIDWNGLCFDCSKDSNDDVFYDEIDVDEDYSEYLEDDNEYYRDLLGY